MAKTKKPRGKGWFMPERLGEIYKEFARQPRWLLVVWLVTVLFGVVGWTSWQIQRERADKLTTEFAETAAKKHTLERMIEGLRHRFGALEKLAERQYPDAAKGKAIDALTKDVEAAKQLGATEKFQPVDARLRFHVSRIIQQGILRYKRVPATFVVIAQGEPALAKSADQFAALLDFSGLHSKFAALERPEGSKPGILVQYQANIEYFVRDLEPATRRYYRAPFETEIVPELPEGEVRILVTGSPLFLRDGTVLLR